MNVRVTFQLPPGRVATYGGVTELVLVLNPIRPFSNLLSFDDADGRVCNLPLSDVVAIHVDNKPGGDL